MFKLKNSLVIFSSAVLFVTPNLFAQSKRSLPKDMKYTVEPLFGYETLFRPTPSPHTVTRTMYGVRLTIGSDLVSGEAEYTKGNDTENFLTAPEKIETQDDKYKLGLRSTYRMNEYLFASARLGGQATQSTVTTTTAGVPTVEKKPMVYHPYLGAHIGLRFGPFSVSAGATAVIRDTSEISNNDIQHTLSISLGN